MWNMPANETHLTASSGNISAVFITICLELASKSWYDGAISARCYKHDSSTSKSIHRDSILKNIPVLEAILPVGLMTIVETTLAPKIP
jgi:hypothetical protein